MWRILKGTVTAFVELNPQLLQYWFIPQISLRIFQHRQFMWGRYSRQMASPYQCNRYSKKQVSRSLPSRVKRMLDSDGEYEAVKLVHDIKMSLGFLESDKALAAIFLMQRMFLAERYLYVIRKSEELLTTASLPPAYHAVARLYYCSTLVVTNSVQEISKYSISLPRSQENLRAWQFIALHELTQDAPGKVLQILSDIPSKSDDIITLNLQIQASVRLKRLPEVLELLIKLMRSHKGSCLCRDTLLSIEKLEGEGTKMLLDRLKRYQKWLIGSKWIIQKDLKAYMVQNINLKEFLPKECF